MSQWLYGRGGSLCTLDRSEWPGTSSWLKLGRSTFSRGGRRRFVEHPAEELLSKEVGCGCPHGALPTQPTANVAVQVGPVQGQGYHGHHQPLEVPAEQGHKEKEGPEGRCPNKPHPEEACLRAVCRLLTRLATLKDPVALPGIVDVVPPAEADQEAACDVLDGPEVHAEQQQDGHKARHKTVREEAAQQVRQQRRRPEGQVEERRHPMPDGLPHDAGFDVAEVYGGRVFRAFHQGLRIDATPATTGGRSLEFDQFDQTGQLSLSIHRSVHTIFARRDRQRVADCLRPVDAQRSDLDILLGRGPH